MSQKIETIVHLIDDIDGSVADNSYEFMWEGRTYAIDLSKKNGAPVEKAMAAIIPHARLVRTSKTSGRRLTEVKTGPDPRAIRAWAAAQTPPVEVNKMGKIPEGVVEQYRAAGN